MHAEVGDRVRVHGRTVGAAEHEGVVIEVRDAGERQALPDHPGATVTWFVGSGKGIGQSRLGALLNEMPLQADPGYLWVAAERAAVRALRAQADVLGCFADDRRKLVAYW